MFSLAKNKHVAMSRTVQSKRDDLGFEAIPWLAADQSRGSMSTFECKHPVLGLIFLKYISGAFKEKHAQLVQEPDANSKNREEYATENIFWIPVDACWSGIATKAKSPQVGEIIDKAMISIERDNPRLRGVCPKNTQSLRMIRCVSARLLISCNCIGLGDAETRKHDVIGHV